MENTSLTTEVFNTGLLLFSVSQEYILRQVASMYLKLGWPTNNVDKSFVQASYQASYQHEYCYIYISIYYHSKVLVVT